MYFEPGNPQVTERKYHHTIAVMPLPGPIQPAKGGRGVY